MGNTRWFEEGRKNPEYITIGEFYGVKIIQKVKGGSCNTPKYSNTSKYYACADRFGEIKQIACYNTTTHAKIYDIDWSHIHGPFKKGEPHVHYYIDGTRQDEPIKPNEKQMRLYYLFSGRKINDKGELE